MSLRLFDNLGLKLTSLVLGFALWYIVAGEQGAEVRFSIPLELRNMPEGLEVLEESVQQVDVRLRGSSEILRGLTPQEILVSVDLSQAGPGERVLYLTPEQVETPFGVRVMRVSPVSVRVRLDRTARRQVRVMPRVVGEPASGFELTAIQLRPEHIELSGPASRLQGLEQVTTEPISAEGLREPYRQSVQILIEDPFVRLAGPGKVEVTLDVREERIEKVLAGVALSLSPPRLGARLTPSSLRAVVAGPKSKIEPLRADDLEGVVPVEGLGPGLHRVAPELKVRSPDPASIEIMSVQPKQVRVRIPQGGQE